MAKQEKTIQKIEKIKVKNKGVHAKSKTSKNKNSKNYKKINNGQG